MPTYVTKRRYIRLAALVLLIATAIPVRISVGYIDPYFWNIGGTGVNGYLLNFYLRMHAAQVQKPELYSPELSGDYSDTPVEQRENMPNILIIMDEAFADLRIFDNPPQTDVPVTPFMDSLKENTVRGYALTSVFGGNTATAEFEMLSGHTMAFLPSGSVAYQQYIREDTFSLPWLAQAYGYTTFATHPYYASGWIRDKVYPFLGFQESTFLDAYDGAALLREYVTDREMFGYALECLQEKPEAERLFLFGITMQNHGGYLYEGENYEKTVSLAEGEYPQAEQYLSLIRETDMAVEYLLTALEDFPQDTIVLFFGDHLPNLDPGFYENLNGGTLDTLQEQMLKQTVPFFIWANYDIPETFMERTSLNYLGLYLLENTGLELPAYYQALKDISQVIPAMNNYGYYSREQGSYRAITEATGKEREMLLLYEQMQYNNLFDEKNRNYAFFGQYLP